MHYGLEQTRIQTEEPLAHLFARLLAPLTRSLAPDCSLRSRPPLRSLVRSLAHFAHSLARGKVNDWMSQNDLVLSHSAVTPQPEEQIEDLRRPQVLILLLLLLSATATLWDKTRSF